jgi:beta-glucanase (GH16 family)
LAFSDEFNGSGLDLAKWRPNWLGGSDTGVTKPVNSSELSCYDPAQARVGSGSLSLTAEPRACTTGNGKAYRYASGLVQSSHDFTYTYGFAEARMYLPPNADPGNGAVGACGPNWPAFWVNGSGATVGEIDVMECLGDNTRWSYHWDNYDRSATALPPGWAGTMPTTADGWHTFGVNWQPGSLDFYYDGVNVGRHTEGVPSDPHYLIANLGVSGSQIEAPQTVRVDYIRVWQ